MISKLSHNERTPFLVRLVHYFCFDYHFSHFLAHFCVSSLGELNAAFGAQTGAETVKTPKSRASLISSGRFLTSPEFIDELKKQNEIKNNKDEQKRLRSQKRAAAKAQPVTKKAKNKK